MYVLAIILALVWPSSSSICFGPLAHLFVLPLKDTKINSVSTGFPLSKHFSVVDSLRSARAKMCHPGITFQEVCLMLLISYCRGRVWERKPLNERRDKRQTHLHSRTRSNNDIGVCVRLLHIFLNEMGA